MASERETVDEAFAGDILGIFDPGIFSIGDTITTAKNAVCLRGHPPPLHPEHFARITQVDTMKRKQFVKGMEQIAQEGAIQIFKELGGGMEEVIVGVVGVLQFEVLEYRLKNEYNVDVRRTALPYAFIRWIDNEDIDPKALNLTSDTRRVEDFRAGACFVHKRLEHHLGRKHNPGLRLSIGKLIFPLKKKKGRGGGWLLFFGGRHKTPLEGKILVWEEAGAGGAPRFLGGAEREICQGGLD